MPFDGTYPCVPGNKRHSIADVSGPASYVPVTLAAGAAPTGGQLISAAVLGLPNVEIAHLTRSDDGMYQVVFYPSPFNKNQPSPNLIAQWNVVATGAQVAAGTNLSGRTFRVYAMGGY